MAERSTQPTTHRRTVLKAVGAAGLTGLAGCTGGGRTDQPTRTPGTGAWPDLTGREVHFLHSDTSEEYQRFYEDLATAFEDATGGRVRVEGVNPGQLPQRASQLLQANDPPEVVQRSFGSSANWALQGILAPVDDVIDAYVDTYGTPPARVVNAVEGQQYQVPAWINGGLNWYRADVFDRPPETWDDQLALAREYDGTDGLRGSFVPAKENICVHHFVMGWAFTNDAQLATRDADGNLRITIGEGTNRDRWIETLGFLDELHDYSPQNTGAGCAEMINAIPLGTAASSWYFGARPKIQAIRQERAFAPDVRPTLGPRNRSQRSTGIVEGFSVFEGADVEAGKAFLEFLMQEQYYIELLLLTPLQNAPPRHIRETSRYQSGLDRVLPDAWTAEDREIVLSLADNIKMTALETTPPNPFLGPIKGSGKIPEMLFEVVIQGGDPAAVVDQYADELQAVVDRVQS